MTSCPHIAGASLRPPRPDESVYRDDCTLCFDGVDDDAGIDVCLHCFNGGCAGERTHNRLHAHHSKHPLALNIKRTRKRKIRDDGEPPEKISRLAIQAETDEDRYDLQTNLHCLECEVDGLESQGDLARVVDGVLKANTYARQQEIKAWEQEMVPCEHTLCLEQEPGRTIASGELSRCSGCDLKENLWLCLTCGNLGCGRQQMGGLPGNSHAKSHAQTTNHPVAVKLGSLTADGSADIYCYGCDDERIDTELVAHLANWEIDIAGRVKTEKSLTEMQLEENLRWDFSMTTQDGTEMKSLFGPGFTGLKNLGNTCYMASVLQSLFAMPEFENRYHRPSESLASASNPAEDLEIQLRKLADGLLSGRYSKPDKDAYQADKDGEQPHQRGIAPAMLKHLVGKGHEEFSTVRQQDSFELLLHLLKLITRSQSGAQAQDKELKDPVDAFRFVMEQKLQCMSCKKVRYRLDEMENLSVAVPIRRLPRQDTTMNGNDSSNDKEEPQFEPVTLQQCLDDFTAPEQVELTCPSCTNKGFVKQSLFKTFPTILTVNARRFEIVNWVPTKQDVPVLVEGDRLDLERYRSKGKRADEEELPEEAVEDTKASESAFVPNEAALEMLMAMGFPRVRCEKALHATGNTSPDMAAAWLFEHMDDPDIDTPLDLGKDASGGGQPNVADAEKIEGLGAMGFSAPQARQALKETGGDMERAVDWLFSHPDATGDFGEDETGGGDEGSTSQVAIAIEDNKPAQFDLKSIVCHKGTSIHAGHYVAFVKKALGKDGEGWVLFNDEKVAMGADADEMKKFAYIYFFRRHED